MSRPISRENSSTNLALNQQNTNPQPEENTEAAKSSPPKLNQKTEAKQPQPSGDTGFSKEDWSKHGQGCCSATTQLSSSTKNLTAMENQTQTQWNEYETH